MSKTDKTMPTRVKNARYGVLIHDHRNGECSPENIGEWCNRRALQPCWLSLENNRRYTAQLRNYERPSCYGYQANQDERSARRKARDTAHKMMLTSDWDLDVEPVRHRHNAIWICA